MDTREMRELLGVSRAEFSRRYGIPVRTLEDWEAGKRQCPEYVNELLERCVREDKEEIVMKVYELKKFTKQFRYSERDEIKTGSTLEDSEPMSIAKFCNLERAQQELAKYEPMLKYYDGAIYCYYLTEYALESYDADEDGEFVSGSDFWPSKEFEFDDELNGIKFL